MSENQDTNGQAEDTSTREDDLLAQAILGQVDNAVVLAQEASYTVLPHEFAVWADTLGATEFIARLQSDGGVRAYIQAQHRDRWIFVHTYADILEGHELPPVGSELAHVALPIEDAKLLKVFEGAGAR